MVGGIGTEEIQSSCNPLNQPRELSAQTNIPRGWVVARNMKHERLAH